MEKYQLALIARLKEQLELWLEAEQCPHTNPDRHSDQQSVATSDELYRFLHTIRGTSGTIGLSRISEEAASLMNALELQPQDEWPRSDLKQFLSPLVVLVQGEHAAAPVKVDAGKAGSNVKGSLLLVDDDEAILAYLTEELGRRGYGVTATTDPAIALRLVHTSNPDAMVLDLHLQMSSGIDIMLAAREQAAAVHTPVLMMSADMSPTAPVQALRLGADDYIVKPLHATELAARLERLLLRKRVAEELASVDSLTAVLNRTQLPELYREAVSATGNTGHDGFLLMFQLANLEQINLTWGEEAGNAALSGLAQCLSSRLSGESESELQAVVRYSGSRFIVLLRGMEKEAVQIYIERVKQRLSTFWPEGEDRGLITVVYTQMEPALEAANETLHGLLRLSRSAKEIAERPMNEQADKGCILEFGS